MNLTYERVQAHLDRLKLRRVAELIDPIAEQATRDKLSYLDFLDRLLDAEAEARAERRMVAKTRLAHFPFVKTLADFEFSFQPTIDKKQVKDLATLRFLANGENVTLLGPPGVGKTHLAVALGMEAVAHGANVYFITVPELLDQLVRDAQENRISDRLRSLRHPPCSSSTRWAMCPSIARPRASCSSRSRSATPRARSSSPRTSHTWSGARCSGTRWPLRRSSIACCTTRPSTSAASPTAQGQEASRRLQHAFAERGGLLDGSPGEFHIVDL